MPILRKAFEADPAWIELTRVSGGGGHYTIEVVSTGFAGKSMLESQRLVLSAIKHLINGERPPVHAVDSLITRTP
jgi:stress-induced morphogen